MLSRLSQCLSHVSRRWSSLSQRAPAPIMRPGTHAASAFGSVLDLRLAVEKKPSSKSVTSEHLRGWGCTPCGATHPLPTSSEQPTWHTRLQIRQHLYLTHRPGEVKHSSPLPPPVLR